MRRKIQIPSLLLSLLCACVDDSRYLLTTAAPDNLVPATAAPRQGEMHYTRHATATTRAEIIAIRVNGPFVRVIGPRSCGPSVNGTWR